MTLKVISSGSSGNAYILDSGKEQLLLECGVKWSNIVKALGYTISNAVGVLVSHRHLDHAKSISNALTYRIPVYSCKDVCERHKGVILIEPNKKYKIGDFVVQPIPVSHDVECYSYLIEHPDCGRILFCTDLSDFPHTVKNIQHFLIESNFSEDILLDRACNNEAIRSHSQNHLSIDSTIDILRRNVCGTTNTITLLHLSVENSDARKFAEMVKDAVGIEPNIALPDFEVELKNEEF